MLNGTETVVGDGDANVAVEKLLDDGRLVVKINAAKKVRLVSRVWCSPALSKRARAFSAAAISRGR